MGRTKQNKSELTKRISDLRAKINKLPMGKKRLEIQKEMWALSYRLKRHEPATTKKRNPVSKDQLEFAKFGEQFDFSRVEKMIAQKIFAAAITRVENEMTRLAELNLPNLVSLKKQA